MPVLPGQCQCWTSTTSCYGQTGRTPAGCYLGGEPVFAPDPARPEGGAVICPEFDAERRTTTFLIFDAKDIAAGPVARLPLRDPIHLAFHASFAPA